MEVRKYIRLFFRFALMLLVAAALLAGCGKGEKASKASFENFSDTSIESANMKSTLDELTSGKYNGRLAGTEGNKRAAEYIAGYFKQIGLESPEGIDNYMQFFSQQTRIVNSIPVLQVIDKSGNVVKEYKYIDQFTMNTYYPGIRVKGEISAPVKVYEEGDMNFAGTDFKGKVVLMPEAFSQSLPLEQVAGKITSGAKNGLQGAIIERNVKAPGRSFDYFAVSPYMLPYTVVDEKGPMLFYVDTPVYNEIKDAAKAGNQVHMKLDCTVETVNVPNVVGIIPGSDEKLKDECIVVGAHFDHVGNNGDGTYNPGAFDNGSGVAAMMEIAESIKESGKAPEKTLVFAAFNGEEEGLFGSQYYASHPVYPLNKSMVINLDMVGSNTSTPIGIESFDDSDTPLKTELYEYANDFGVAAEKSYSAASDHVPFIEHGADAVSLCTMDFSLGYHKSTDTVNGLDMAKMKKIADVVLYYIDRNAY
jgi:hypothetical protein